MFWAVLKALATCNCCGACLACMDKGTTWTTWVVCTSQRLIIATNQKTVANSLCCGSVPNDSGEAQQYFWHEVKDVTKEYTQETVFGCCGPITFSTSAVRVWFENAAGLFTSKLVVTSTRP